MKISNSFFAEVVQLFIFLALFAYVLVNINNVTSIISTSRENSYDVQAIMKDATNINLNVETLTGQMVVDYVMQYVTEYPMTIVTEKSTFEYKDRTVISQLSTPDSTYYVSKDSLFKVEKKCNKNGILQSLTFKSIGTVESFTDTHSLEKYEIQQVLPSINSTMSWSMISGVIRQTWENNKDKINSMNGTIESLNEKINLTQSNLSELNSVYSKEVDKSIYLDSLVQATDAYTDYKGRKDHLEELEEKIKSIQEEIDTNKLKLLAIVNSLEGVDTNDFISKIENDSLTTQDVEQLLNTLRNEVNE